jgi:ABC-type amino acid transport substrate-binding protein
MFGLFKRNQSILFININKILKVYKSTAFFFIIAQVGFGCTEYPKDPNRTLHKVTNGNLTVGYSENFPWVVKKEGEPEPSGIEPALIKSFASTLHAKIIWENGSEEQLFKKLEDRKIDVVIAGLTDETPWKTRMIGLTKPYRIKGNEKHVIAVQEGENAFLIQLEIFLNMAK